MTQPDQQPSRRVQCIRAGVESAVKELLSNFYQTPTPFAPEKVSPDMAHVSPQQVHALWQTAQRFELLP